MKALRDTGKIELEVQSGSYGAHALEYNPEKANREHSEDFFPPAFIKMRKLKSLN